MRRVERVLVAAALLLGAGSANAEFVSTPVTTAHEGLPYRYEVVATGFGRVRITAPNGLPPWLTLVETGNGTALLSGTPSAGDSGAGIVLRSEDTSCTAFQVFCYRYQFFDIAIIPNAPPEIVTDLEDQVATEGTPFRLDFGGAFRDPDGDSLSYSVSGLPPGFSASGNVISGTPTPADVDGSPYEVSISASDGRGGTAVETFALRIDALARADLAVESIAPSPSPAIVEQPVEWSFEIVNRGPAESGDVELEIVFAGSEVELGSHPCAAEADHERQRLVCRISPVEPDENETVSVTTTAPNAGDVYVTARIRGGADRPIDPTTANDVATAALNVGVELRTDAAQQLEGRLLDIAAGDVDADGFDDIVAATPEDAPAALHLNIVDPTGLHPTLRENGASRRGLSTLSLSLGDPVANTAAALADFDGDGDLDAVVVNAPGEPALVFENDGSGAFAEAVPLGDGRSDARDVAVADLDGDGLPDIVVANAGQSVVYFRRGDAFEAVPLPRPPRESIGVAVLDANGDALQDVVLANADGDASIYHGDGARFAPPVPLETGPTRAVAAGDFDGDGAPDLVFARTVPGPDGLPSNPVYINDGAGRFGVAAELGASPTIDVLVTDLDGDERLDILFVNATGAHQRFLGDGDGAFTLDPALLVAPGGAKGAAARIGLRETTDLLIAGANGLSVFFNDGLGALGLGDVEPPVIELVGEPEIAVQIDEDYEDPGAIATDDVDGELTAKVDNPVDTKVIGTYTVTYTAVDGAGNEAVPVTRTVRVETRAAQGGGGGGSVGTVWLALLAVAAWLGMRRSACSALEARADRRPRE